MASARVERVLGEIAQLSREERQEFRAALPGVLEADTDGGLNSAALAQARANRERIRARLRAEGRPFGSVNEDLELVREGRLRDIMRSLPAPARRHES